MILMIRKIIIIGKISSVDTLDLSDMNREKKNIKKIEIVKRLINWYKNFNIHKLVQEL